MLLFNYSSIDTLYIWGLVFLCFAMNYFRILTNKKLTPTHWFSISLLINQSVISFLVYLIILNTLYLLLILLYYVLPVVLIMRLLLFIYATFMWIHIKKLILSIKRDSCNEEIIAKWSKWCVSNIINRSWFKCVFIL